MVKRPSGFITTAAALFGLLVLPCALSCLEIPDEASSAAQHAEPSCHEQNSDSLPREAPSSHEDCCFESAYEALLPGSGASSSARTLTAMHLRASWQPLEASMGGALAVPVDSQLPSPDILLLKSTLLI